MAQNTQTANDSPPAKAGTHSSKDSMAGVKADSADVNASVSSAGIQGASQSGMRKPSVAPAPPVRAPAFEIVHAVIEWNVQAASDHSARRPNTTNQLNA